MPVPQSSKPLLPAELVKKILYDDMMVGFKSDIFGSMFHEMRLTVRNYRTPMSPDAFIMQGSAIGFKAEMKRTALHSAAYDGDVLAVHELLAWGATADKPDTSGITPIYLAISHISLISSSVPGAVFIRSDTGRPTSSTELKREISRLTAVARILVEQHVGLNTTINGETLIYLLCRAKAWDLIALFFEHGADPPKPKDVAALFRTAADRGRFKTMLQERTNVTSRPPRKCPCGSGIPVSECHATSQPYSLEYVCICGSGKTYEKCCFYRKYFVTGQWNPNTNLIVYDFENSATHIYEKAIGRRYNEVHEAIASATGNPLDQDSLNPPTLNLEVLRMLAKELVKKDPGSIDPAFAYAFVRSTFLPRPWGRKRPREICEAEQAEWNALVDEYIETQSDKRTRYNIECAAKIGVWHGALYRRCEGPGCGEVEGPNVAALKHCSGCKISVYCSPKCQKATWEDHKKECGKDGQREQSLSSQDILLDRARKTTDEGLKLFQQVLDYGAKTFT